MEIRVYEAHELLDIGAKYCEIGSLKFWVMPKERGFLFHENVGKLIYIVKSEMYIGTQYHYAECGKMVPMWACERVRDDYESIMEKTVTNHLIGEQLIVLEASNSTDQEINEALDYLNEVGYFKEEEVCCES